jgi:hypothetical protein
MGTQANFILKVLILSAGVSVLIKYGGPLLPVTATSVNAMIAILTPTFNCSDRAIVASEEISAAELNKYLLSTVL